MLRMFKSVLRNKRGRKLPVTEPFRPSMSMRIDDLHEPNFPVDLVYTWVDGSDPEQIARVNEYLPEGQRVEVERFTSHDELKYALRSAHMFVPWINHIYIVTNGQVPTWLANHPKISIITHDAILDSKYLPTFNSHVIESALHHIPGLSEHYVYLNDDVAFLRPMTRLDFFSSGGLSYGIVSSVPLPNGPITPDQPISVAAQKNSARLIFEEWGVWLDRRFKHTFYPQRKSVALDNEKLFADHFDKTRSNRFRTHDDIVVCTTLNGYSGYLTGRGLIRRNRTHYIKIKDADAPKAFSRVLNEKNTKHVRESICLNDTYAENEDENYRENLYTFLEKYYPRPSPYEK